MPKEDETMETFLWECLLFGSVLWHQVIGLRDIVETYDSLARLVA